MKMKIRKSLHRGKRKLNVQPIKCKQKQKTICEGRILKKTYKQARKKLNPNRTFYKNVSWLKNKSQRKTIKFSQNSDQIE